MIGEYPNGTVKIHSLFATDLQGAREEARHRQDEIDALQVDLDKKSREEPVIVTGTPAQMAALERHINLGRQSDEKRKARRRQQRASRKRNRP
jgi:hypothetical protein